jgi:hypothetical protein
MLVTAPVLREKERLVRPEWKGIVVGIELEDIWFGCG